MVMNASQRRIFNRIMPTAKTRVIKNHVARELYGAPPIVEAYVNPGRAAGMGGLGSQLSGTGNTKREAYEDLRTQVEYRVEGAL